MSFEAYGDEAMNLDYCYIMRTSTGNTSLGVTIPITTEPSKYTYAFTAENDYAECSIMLGAAASDTLASIYIRNLKLERGNMVTDWTPAPGDLEEGVLDAQNSSDANGNRLNDAESEIVKLRESISTLVRGANGESLMTQTENGWSFSLSSFIDQLNDASGDISDLSSNVDDVTAIVDGLNSIVQDIGNRTEYINLGTENGKPCILLGETDSAFKVVITNTDIRFMEGTTTPARISNQRLNIEKAEVRDELKQGGFVWKARPNGNYGLMWKGE